MNPLRTFVLSLCIVSPLGAQDAAPDAAQTPPTVSSASPREIRVAAPDPDELQLEMGPSDEVVLEMPGGSAQQSTVSRDAETISVDFPDEEVRTIIRNVADLYELNVVIPDSLVGSVSLKLRNVTWRQVFDVMLTPLGFTYVEEGNIIKVKSQQDLLAEPVDTRVFVINFASAAELSPTIGPLIDNAAGGRIQVDNRSNALIVTERPSRMGRIIEIIERLDRPTEQVMIESKFVEVTNRDLFDLGVNWTSLRGYNGSATWRREYDGTRTDTDGSSTSQQITQAGVLVPPASTITSEDTVSLLDEVIRSDSTVLDFDTFNVLLSALESNDEIELISNPTVVTLNNTPAIIHIGDQYPIPNYVYNEEQGTYEINGFEYKDIGISLEVLPQVNTAGFINLKIHPEISSETGTVTFGGASGAIIPVITRRTTQSTVTIKSGYTLAIGGLMERTTATTDTKVPLLGDIPIIGRAFRHDSDSQDQRNLIIFITAKILNADGSTYRDVFSQRRLYEMGIKERELPGYEPPEGEEALFDELQVARDEIEQIQAEARLQAQLRELRKRQERNEKNAETERNFKSRAR